MLPGVLCGACAMCSTTVCARACVCSVPLSFLVGSPSSFFMLVLQYMRSWRSWHGAGLGLWLGLGVSSHFGLCSSLRQPTISKKLLIVGKIELGMLTGNAICDGHGPHLACSPHPMRVALRLSYQLATAATHVYDKKRFFLLDAAFHLLISSQPCTSTPAGDARAPGEAAGFHGASAGGGAAGRASWQDLHPTIGAVGAAEQVSRDAAVWRLHQLVRRLCLCC